MRHHDALHAIRDDAECHPKGLRRGTTVPMSSGQQVNSPRGLDEQGAALCGAAGASRRRDLRRGIRLERRKQSAALPPWLKAKGSKSVHEGEPPEFCIENKGLKCSGLCLTIDYIEVWGSNPRRVYMVQRSFEKRECPVGALITTKATSNSPKQANSKM